MYFLQGGDVLLIEQFGEEVEPQGGLGRVWEIGDGEAGAHDLVLPGLEAPVQVERAVG